MSDDDGARLFDQEANVERRQYKKMDLTESLFCSDLKIATSITMSLLHACCAVLLLAASALALDNGLGATPAMG
jgi:hypothetical protein